MTNTAKSQTKEIFQIAKQELTTNEMKNWGLGIALGSIAAVGFAYGLDRLSGGNIKLTEFMVPTVPVAAIMGSCLLGHAFSKINEKLKTSHPESILAKPHSFILGIGAMAVSAVALHSFLLPPSVPNIVFPAIIGFLIAERVSMAEKENKKQQAEPKPQ